MAHPHARKLLYVVNKTAYFCSHRLSLAKAAQAEGYEVHVAAPEKEGSEQLLSEGMYFHELPLVRKSLSLWQEWKTLRAIFKLYKKLKPDLVQNITIKPVLYGGIVARFFPIPARVSLIPGLGYVFSASSHKARILQFALRFFYPIALNHGNHRVIVQNPDDKATLLQGKMVKPQYVCVILGSGVDLKQFTVTPLPEKPVVTLAARLVKEKGIYEFIAAAKAMQQLGIEAKFLLVGDSDEGNYSAIPSAELKAWHQSGLIEWHPWRRDMDVILQQTQIFCFPSYFAEGVPKVLLEAAASGRPIITLDKPGCREVVKQGENGYLVTEGNQAELNQRLKSLLEDPERCRTMGLAGRKRCEALFSLEKINHETLALYAMLSVREQ